MDPTIIAAIAGVLGVILGAVIGGVFALKATKRQIEVMMVSARGDVNERLYKQSVQISCASLPRSRHCSPSSPTTGI